MTTSCVFSTAFITWAVKVILKMIVYILRTIPLVRATQSFLRLGRYFKFWSSKQSATKVNIFVRNNGILIWKTTLQSKILHKVNPSRAKHNSFTSIYLCACCKLIKTNDSVNRWPSCARPPSFDVTPKDKMGKTQFIVNIKDARGGFLGLGLYQSVPTSLTEDFLFCVQKFVCFS